MNSTYPGSFRISQKSEWLLGDEGHTGRVDSRIPIGERKKPDFSILAGCPGILEP